MASTFPGYPKRGITFLRQLGKNNNRPWFQEHKRTYEQDVKAPTAALVDALNGKLESFAPDYVVDPKKATFRINRDIRFSKDKSPYNTWVAARFTCRGRQKDESAGFYFRVSPKGVDIVGGAYMPGTPALNRLRAHLAENQKAFERLVKRKSITDRMGALQGEQLKRVPRGWPADHPAGDLLRHKQLYFHTQLPVAIATTPELFKELVARYRAMTPFVEFLDAGLGAKAKAKTKR